MNKTKKEKDMYPKIYGYGDLEVLKKEIEKGIFDEQGIRLTNWIHFIDIDGHIRFVPCTKEYFYKHRNLNRNEQRRENRAREKCPVSMDDLKDKYNYEFPDPSYAENIEKQQEEDLVDYLWELVSEFKEIEQTIIRLHFEGYTDAQIGVAINRATSSVQERRVKLIEKLREKATKFR